MTRRFRGSVVADGFVLDARLIGEAEARRRTLAAWQPGSRASALPDGRWLVQLSAPQRVRIETAPGVPLTKAGSGWAAVGLTPTAGTLTLLQSGEIVLIALELATPLEVGQWIDISDLQVHHLLPVDPPSVERQGSEMIRPAAPDLRQVATLAPPSRAALRFARRATAMASTPETERVTRSGPGAEVRVVPLVFGLLVAVSVITRMGPVGASLLLVAAATVFGIIWMASRPTTEVSNGSPPPRSLATLGIRIMLRTPLRSLVVRRQRAYLRELTEHVDKGDWDAALRDAIGLGGTAVPSSAQLRRAHRSSLTPSLRPQSGRGAHVDPMVSSYLFGLYERAATELEQAGRITEAAFVLSDLLNDPVRAVGLLERHHRFELAAALADGHDLDPDLVVRLWWQAGDRARAIDAARARGAFAGAVDLLRKVDPAGATALREIWVGVRLAVDDVVGAVDAAWPEVSVRSTVMPALEAHSQPDDPRGAYLFAHLVAQNPSEENVARAVEFLGGRDGEHSAARSRFIETFARLGCADPSADRQVASAAARAAFRTGHAGTSARRAIDALRQRADPLLRADLPSITRPVAPVQPAELAVDLDAGQLPVFDVAVLGPDTLLIAHGEVGVRLLTLDGRVKARWSVPTHQLVVADHGARALLVQAMGGPSSIHHLDLVSRRLRPWTTLTAQLILPSFDGDVLAVVDEDGIAFVDVRADRPRTIWRELDNQTRVVAVSRTPEHMTAFIVAPSGLDARIQLPQLRVWSQPDGRTRANQLVDLPLDPVVDLALVARRAIMLTEHGTLIEAPTFAEARSRHVGAARLTASGNFYALSTPLDERRATVSINAAGRQVMRILWPSHEPVGIRWHDGRLAVWDNAGRIAAVDLDEDHRASLLTLHRTSI